MRTDLSSVATTTLERLRDSVAGGRVSLPLTRSVLLDQGIKHQLDALEGALAGLSSLAVIGVLEAVLAERRANLHAAPELVWTGPERSHATARDTAVVLRELFEKAGEQVIVAGYDFTRGSSLLEPLWLAMRDRGVDVQFFVHIQQPELGSSDPAAHCDSAVRALMDDLWTFGSPRPRVYYDARALSPTPRFNMHAKCVVVDGRWALVTSANFTQRAQEQNLECGVLLDDPAFSRHLARQWMGLVEAGLVREWMGPRS